MVGGLIIVECEDMAAARTLAACDPYRRPAFWSVAIRPGKGSPKS